MSTIDVIDTVDNVLTQCLASYQIPGDAVMTKTESSFVARAVA